MFTYIRNARPDNDQRARSDAVLIFRIRNSEDATHKACNMMHYGASSTLRRTHPVDQAHNHPITLRSVKGFCLQQENSQRPYFTYFRLLGQLTRRLNPARQAISTTYGSCMHGQVKAFPTCVPLSTPNMDCPACMTCNRQRHQHHQQAFDGKGATNKFRGISLHESFHLTYSTPNVPLPHE